MSQFFKRNQFLILGGNSLQAQQVQLVTWMLKHHLITHLHTYVYLSTYFDGSMLESGMDYLAAFSGDPDGDGSANFSLNIRPFEVDEDDATASDTFSETTVDEVGVGHQEIDIGVSNLAIDGSTGEGRPIDSLSANPTLQTITNEESEESVVKFTGASTELNEAVRRAVSMIKNPLSIQDIKMFSRLSKYFTGDFHFEEIMYRENVRRSQLMLLLDKFRDVLITVEKEDAEINFFKLR